LEKKIAVTTSKQTRTISKKILFWGLKRTKFKPVRNENCYIYNIMTTMYQKLRDHHLQIHAIHADFHVGNIFHLRYHAHA